MSHGRFLSNPPPLSMSSFTSHFSSISSSAYMAEAMPKDCSLRNSHRERVTAETVFHPRPSRRSLTRSMQLSILFTGSERRLLLELSNIKVMEKIPAASAMEWSIDLEKSLRSRKPGLAIEIISKFGPRLVQWGREPEPNVTSHAIFSLVPCEDRLFANTILLRLAEAFRTGDKYIRLSIVSAFLYEFKHRDKKKCKRYNGLLSKSRVSNHLELLKKVKVVFYENNDDERAFALVLFGCWADFAKDNAQIRYLVLSSLVSSQDFVVKASLFAAGCFSELSDDFACIVIEMLVNMVTSSATSVAVRLAGVRVFAKLKCTYAVAKKAYKAGLEILMHASDENFLLQMLLSLSKLASISSILISEHMNLLLSFLSPQITSHLRLKALRCLRFIFGKGRHRFHVVVNLVKTMFALLDEHGLPSNMQCAALQFLHQIIIYILPTPHVMDLHVFSKLIAVGETASNSPLLLETHLAINILAELACCTVENNEIGCNLFYSSLPSRVLSLIVNQITLSVTSLMTSYGNSNVYQDIENLLKQLLYVIGKHPYLGVLLVDNINSVTEHLLNFLENSLNLGQHQELNDDIVCSREKKRTIAVKLVLKVHGFMLALLEILKNADSITTAVLGKVQILVEQVRQCSLISHRAHTLYSMLLHNRFVWCCIGEIHESFNAGDSLGHQRKLFVKHDIDTMKCIQKMLIEEDNWCTYRVGSCAASQGSWFVAAFVFGKLMPKVNSDPCRCWLQLLSQFAHAEGRIQFICISEHRSTLHDWFEINKVPATFSHGDCGYNDPGTGGNIKMQIYFQELSEAYKILRSSMCLLESAVKSDQAFNFQMWFLSLRTKLLGDVADTLKEVRSLTSNLDSNSKMKHVENNLVMQSSWSFEKITQISLHLEELSEELDLMGISFFDLDDQSSKVISALALSCSFLAFSLIVILSPIFNHDSNDQQSFSCLENLTVRYSLVKNFARRFRCMQPSTRDSLTQLLNNIQKPKDFYHLCPCYKNPTYTVDRDLHYVCSYAVSKIVCLHGMDNADNNMKNVSQIAENGSLLLDIIIKWLQIPFRIPLRFLKVRQCIGVELLTFNADYSNMSCVTQGCSLSLDLCLQVRNVPPNLHVRLKKLHCMLYCSMLVQETGQIELNQEQKPSTYRAWKDPDMVGMNTDLYCHVSNQSMSKTSIHKCKGDSSNGEVVKVFVCLLPNEKGQGFSRCTLDVGVFPVGSYRIKWHACCVDSKGSYWSLLPLNPGPVITINKPAMD